MFEALNQQTSGIDERVPPEQAEALRAEMAQHGKDLQEAHEEIRSALEAFTQGKPVKLLDAEKAAHFERLKALEKASLEAFEARLARQPKLPPPPKIDLLDGHTLGKILLTRLSLVRSRSGPTAPLIDETGFRWESSEEWERLGM
jgi:hypothetical protein